MIFVRFVKKEYDYKALQVPTVIIYEIERNYVYRDFEKNKDKFDFSEYPESSKFYDETNGKVIGKTKVVVENTFVGFVGLRSKM